MSDLNLPSLEAAARDELDSMFSARELAIENGRKVIRQSSRAIRAIHRGEIDQAVALMDQAGAFLSESVQAVADHPGINAGIVEDAAKEYAEAGLFLAISQGDDLPSLSEMGMPAIPYLHGLGEVVGELRRRLLDHLRREDFSEAERLLEIMDEVVDLLAALDYPDGMTAGLRRKTDVARSIAERSRSDLTSAFITERLREDVGAVLDQLT
ncbi:MAG: haloacid dehalogenase [Acidimicrobiia bacterium]|nr:haloacid dehalogenase [bacterium]MXX63483.1 haloacid dehalogenase [Acidimicrobiia bacterium]MCY3652844.1 haloacid dehalogenase [bacterium]MDE0643700.1 haloacid dehalogenase [bacterium]MXZ06191.1 haloacid dehalogenase [Acidimicrobiia bacterium]